MHFWDLEVASHLHSIFRLFQLLLQISTWILPHSLDLGLIYLRTSFQNVKKRDNDKLNADSKANTCKVAVMHVDLNTIRKCHVCVSDVIPGIWIQTALLLNSHLQLGIFFRMDLYYRQ